MNKNLKVRYIILIFLIATLIIINLKFSKNPVTRENFENKNQGMELVLPRNSTYEEHIKLAKELHKNKKPYAKPVIWHAYWHGDLNEKHLISIRSCYYFNVLGHSNRKIILWLEKITLINTTMILKNMLR